MHPHDYIAVHCPFLASLRGTAEFQRIVGRAAERVWAFERDVMVVDSSTCGRPAPRNAAVFTWGRSTRSRRRNRPNG
jgi:hypothetical protein